jgi:hypothetical protein
VDWLAARPRSGAAVAELRSLIDAQARQARAAGLLPAQLVPALPDGADVDQDADAHADEPLRALLDLDEAWRPFRIAVIGRNELFPPQWRDAAWTTLLPHDAATAVARWRWWYEQVVAGTMVHYRRRLAAWDTARKLTEHQATLVGTANLSLTRANAWTQTPALRDAREEVLRLPAVPALAVPVDPSVDDGPDADQDELVEAVDAHAGRLREVTARFNACVPGPYKCRLLLDAKQGGRDPWLEEFFDWVDPVITSGRGLYLWA